MTARRRDRKGRCLIRSEYRKESVNLHHGKRGSLRSKRVSWDVVKSDLNKETRIRVRCNCWQPLSVRQAVIAVIDETKEFCAEPALDEWDDVKVCLKRLVGSFFKKSSIQIFDTPLCDSKAAERMNSYGCIHSKRHLNNGRCPSSNV